MTMTGASPKPSLDPGAISSLIRLRSMLLRGVRDASDPTEMSRHLAIVTLDAAVENALRISAHYSGIAIKPEASFHDALNRLQSASSLQWKSIGGRGVVELHAARNMVQHVGILPEGERLTGWSVDAMAFIRELVNAAFHVSLDEVLLADAIREPGLRDLVSRSEESLGSGDPLQAFILADTAFRQVRQRWRDRRQEVSPGVRRGSAVVFADPDPTTVDGAIDHLEVQVFASDIAPYTQLLVTRRHVSGGGPHPDKAEARNALMFVFDWILRWELFEAGYPAERYAEYWTGLGPPDDGGPPGIAWTYLPERTSPSPHRPEQYQLLVQFKNLPERGRTDWGIDFPYALKQAQTELQIDDQQAIQQAPLSHGAMVFLFEQQLPPETLATLLATATDIATDLFNERQQHKAELRTRVGDLQTQLRNEIADACAIGVVYGLATVLPELTPEGPAYRARIPLINPTPQELNLAWAGFTGKREPLTNISIQGAEITFQLRDFTEDDRQRLRDAVCDTDETIQRYRRAESEAELRRQEYARKLTSLLGEPPARDT